VRTAGDPSLAAERTEIAWGRTGLAVAACVAVTLRRVPSMSGGELTVVVLGVALVLGAVLVVLSARLSRSRDERPIAVVRDRLRRQAMVTSMVGIFCLVIVIPALF
jgi:uncharacterized membrane protein YidH (DUF202 family)